MIRCYAWSRRQFLKAAAGAGAALQVRAHSLRAAASPAASAPVPGVVAELRAEVLKPNTDPGGWPLPVASHWARGFGRDNFSSDYQVSLLEQGHHVLPNLPLPDPGNKGEKIREEGWAVVDRLAQWKAPMSLRGDQWEQVLLSKNDPVDAPGKWRNLPPEKSPLIIEPDGKVGKWISPFNAVEPWYEAGCYTTASAGFKEYQRRYPDPPLVILLSNNEARILKPKQDIEAMSLTYVQQHGKGRPDIYLRRVMAEGYARRYRELLRGVRDGLENPAWKANARRVAYGAFGPPHFARWEEWPQHSYATETAIDPWHNVWDGSSPSYYTHNWNDSSDYRVHSPQVEAMNWIFMLEETYRDRPNYWFELSIWDGNSAGEDSKNKSKKEAYLKAGQTWTPERYGGFVQFGMWLVRPRVVREFRGHGLKRKEFEPYFMALVAGVDRVWQQPVLQKFWRQGRLVPNRARRHPYQSLIPERWRNADRWFLLSTNLDPPGEWTLATEIPVFSLARVMGEPGAREWLLFAHSPVTGHDGVTITLPEYGPIRVNVSRGGSFYRIQERDKSVTPVPPV
jgi:hypothetical protein